MVVYRVCKGLPCAQNRAHGKGLFFRMPPAKHKAKIKTHGKEAFCRVTGLAHGKSETLPCAIVFCRVSKV